MELCHLYMKKAGEFLAWCGMANVRGPINACSNGVVSMEEIIHFIEEKTGIKAFIQKAGEI